MILLVRQRKARLRVVNRLNKLLEPLLEIVPPA
jgi:hypothetical protein